MQLANAEWTNLILFTTRGTHAANSRNCCWWLGKWTNTCKFIDSSTIGSIVERILVRNMHMGDNLLPTGPRAILHKPALVKATRYGVVLHCFVKKHLLRDYFIWCCLFVKFSLIFTWYLLYPSERSFLSLLCHVE